MVMQNLFYKLLICVIIKKVEINGKKWWCPMTIMQDGETDYSHKDVQIRDMTAYFAVRIMVFLALLCSYLFTLKSDLTYVQFILTTLLLYLPFLLDYYPRICKDRIEQWVRRLGITVPFLLLSITVIVGIYNAVPEFWMSNPPQCLKIVCICGGVLFVVLSVLDYNNYQRGSKLASTYKLAAIEQIEENKTEEVESRIKRVEQQKKEGLKKVALEKERKGNTKKIKNKK